MAFIFRKPNSRFWYAGWKDENGKRINRSTRVIAKETKQSRKDAQRIADEYEGASQRAKSAKQVRKTLVELHREILGDDAPTATLREYAVRYCDVKKGETSEKGLNQYRLSIDRFIVWLGKRAEQDVSVFSSSDINGYRNHLLEKVASSTAGNQIKALKAMFRMAHEEGLCLENPAANVRLSKKSTSTQERRAFTLDELKAILGAANGEWKSMITFGLYTGQRLGDLATIRWSAIGLERSELRILTRKTKHPILQPIAKPLQEHILTMEAPDIGEAYLHPDLAEIYERSGSGILSNQFAEILAKVGLRAKSSHRKRAEGRTGPREKSMLSFHSLRATAVTLLHQAGVPASMVEQWVGHNSKEVHRRYVKHEIEAMTEATKNLPNLIS